MGKLTIKEQTLIAYYVFNFLDDTDDAMKELEGVLGESIEESSKVTEELKGKGLVNSTKEDAKQRITNEGVLYVDNILHIQSDANERNKLDYVKHSLLINEIEISADSLKKYIRKHVGIIEEIK